MNKQGLNNINKWYKININLVNNNNIKNKNNNNNNNLEERSLK